MGSRLRNRHEIAQEIRRQALAAFRMGHCDRAVAESAEALGRMDLEYGAVRLQERAKALAKGLDGLIGVGSSREVYELREEVAAYLDANVGVALSAKMQVEAGPMRMQIAKKPN